MEMSTLLNGSPIPKILYGTTQRENKDPLKVLAALRAGYLGIDTASSRRFHLEDQDDKALSEYFSQPEARRDGVLVQSKYAPPTEQADPWPYSVLDDTTSRVLKSVLRSAEDLGVDVLDVYFLRTPLNSLEGSMEVWKVLEQLVLRGGIRYLGIANVKAQRLRQLLKQQQQQQQQAIGLRPRFVQNCFKFRESTGGYDREVVELCKEYSIVYQVFGVFNEGNHHLLNCKPVKQWAEGQNITRHQALLQMLMAAADDKGLRICFLDGTTDPKHMEDNLAAVVGESQDGGRPSSEQAWAFSRLIEWV